MHGTRRRREGMDLNELSPRSLARVLDAVDPALLDQALALRAEAPQVPPPQDANAPSDGSDDGAQPAMDLEPRAPSAAALALALSRGLERVQRDFAAEAETFPERSYARAWRLHCAAFADEVSDSSYCVVSFDGETASLLNNASFVEMVAFDLANRDEAFFGYGMPRLDEPITYEAAAKHDLRAETLEGIEASPQPELLRGFADWLDATVGTKTFLLLEHGDKDVEWLRSGFDTYGIASTVFDRPVIVLDTCRAARKLLGELQGKFALRGRLRAADGGKIRRRAFCGPRRRRCACGVSTTSPCVFASMGSRWPRSRRDAPSPRHAIDAVYPTQRRPSSVHYCARQAPTRRSRILCWSTRSSPTRARAPSLLRSPRWRLR